MFFVMEVDVFRFKQTIAISSSKTNEHNGCKKTSNSTASPFFKTTTSGFVLMRYRSFPSITLNWTFMLLEWRYHPTNFRRVFRGIVFAPPICGIYNTFNDIKNTFSVKIMIFMFLITQILWKCFLKTKNKWSEQQWTNEFWLTSWNEIVSVLSIFCNNLSKNNNFDDNGMKWVVFICFWKRWRCL